MYNVKLSDGNRNSVIEYIVKKKESGKFTVIDIGGSMNGWSSPYIDALVDFNEKPEIFTKKYFKIDITNQDSWEYILDYIKVYGKFDFCICTHTLEDIMNPDLVCRMMEKISEGGYIAVPSKYVELKNNVEDSPYKGYIHHRWIFNIENNVFVGYPKVNFIEYVDFRSLQNTPASMHDLSFYWKSNIPICYVNNNYLGPSKDHVINMYTKLNNGDL